MSVNPLESSDDSGINPQPHPPAVAAWTPKKWAALAVVWVVLVIVLIWMGSRIGGGLSPEERAAQERVAQERAAPLAGTSAAEMATAKVGDLRAADLGKGIKLLLCGIPAGTFTMGCSESGWGDRRHEVTLTQPFWLGRTEVTQGQWDAMMESRSKPSFFKGKELPVEQVSWNDAQEFCRKLNAKSLLPDGMQWALPTEAQWEYACRAGATGEYAGNLDDMAWYDINSGGTTHEVGTKKANAWGLHDMHGNVWEWCADWYGDYPAGAVTDPVGPGSGSNRVDRGGSWINGRYCCRFACRDRGMPDSRGNLTGFRVAAVPVGAGVPVGGAGEVKDERVVPLARTSAAEMATAKAGDRRAADLGGGTALVLLGIPAGTFTMGGAGSDEKSCEVKLTTPFWFGRTVVTQGQWDAVMGSNPSHFKGKDLPVENVSWNDAREYCKKLNAKSLLPDGWQWALPTEAQWEYACRAGTTGDYYAGNLDDTAWHSSNSGGVTHAVAMKKANAWGLYDMQGNVCEWCADWYDVYPAGLATDPVGPNSGSSRVCRGSCWCDVGAFCRLASRDWDTPDYRGNNLGFRVAAVPAGVSRR